MPNVYISLGVHGFFRDAPTTLLGLQRHDVVSCSCMVETTYKSLCYLSVPKLWHSYQTIFTILEFPDESLPFRNHVGLQLAKIVKPQC